MSPREIGNAVRRLRGKRGMTQDQLARAAGITQPSLSKLESGRTKDPAVRMMEKIAKALGVSIEELL